MTGGGDDAACTGELGVVLVALNMAGSERGGADACGLQRHRTRAYRDMFALPGARRLAAAVFCARVGNGALLTTLGVGRVVTGSSLSEAAVVAASFAVMHALFAPAQARQAARQGLGRVTRLYLAGFAAALVALEVGLLAGAGFWVLLAGAALLGVTYPTPAAATREIWWRMTDSEAQRRTFSAWESAATPAAYALAPALAIGALTVTSTVVVLAAAGALVIAGAWTLASHPAAGAAPRKELPRSGLLPQRAMGALLGMYTCFNASRGAMNLGVVAVCVAQGRPLLGGVLLGAPSLTAVGGGLWFGARMTERTDLQRVLKVSLLAQGVVIAGLLVSTAWPVLVGCVLAAGLVKAPTPACAHHLAAHASAGRAGEATAWMGTSIVLGSALGQAVAGPLGDSAGPVWLFALAAGLLIVGAALSIRMGERALGTG